MSNKQSISKKKIAIIVGISALATALMGGGYSSDISSLSMNKARMKR